MGAGEGGGGHSPVKTHKATLYSPQLKSKTGVKQTQSHNQLPPSTICQLGWGAITLL